MSKPSLSHIKHAVAALYGINPRLLISLNKMTERKTFVHFAHACRPELSAQEIGEAVNFSPSQVSTEWIALSNNPTRRELMAKIIGRLQVKLKEVPASYSEKTMVSYAPSKSSRKTPTAAAAPLTAEIATTVATPSLPPSLPELEGPMGKIIRFTMKEYSLSYAQIASKSCARVIVNARNTVLYLAREIEKLSFSEIIDFFPLHEANGFSIKLGAFRRKLGNDADALEDMLKVKDAYLAFDATSLD